MLPSVVVWSARTASSYNDGCSFSPLVVSGLSCSGGEIFTEMEKCTICRLTTGNRRSVKEGSLKEGFLEIGVK